MTETVTLDELAATLALGPHELVGLVGGGGKTTTLFALGRQLPGRVVLTTTTKMGRDRTDGLEVQFAPSDGELEQSLAEHRRVLVWGAEAGAKAIGVPADRCDRWFDLADHVLVEADGSRQLPCTAPGPFEPVLPARTTTAIACVGSSAFGRVIADQARVPRTRQRSGSSLARPTRSATSSPGSLPSLAKMLMRSPGTPLAVSRSRI